MSNLEAIIPSLELCKKIPKGAFNDSALWWIEEYIPGNKIPVDFYTCRRGTCEDSHGGYFLFYPAPTTSEICDALLQALPSIVVSASHSGYAFLHTDCDIDGSNFNTIEVKDAKLPDAALRMWLKLKDDDNEQDV